MTPRQQEIFGFIRDRIERANIAPTLDEIAEKFSFSKPRACTLVAAFVEEGLLVRKHPGTAGLCLPGHIDLSPVTTDQLRGELARRGVTLEALKAPKVPLGEGRPCAANHCPNRVHRGHLMCREHWWKLSQQLRSAILNAYSARDTQAYSGAVEAARDYLGGFTRVVERCE